MLALPVTLCHSVSRPVQTHDYACCTTKLQHTSIAMASA